MHPESIANYIHMMACKANQDSTEINVVLRSQSFDHHTLATFPLDYHYFLLHYPRTDQSLDQVLADVPKDLLLQTRHQNLDYRHHRLCHLPNYPVPRTESFHPIKINEVPRNIKQMNFL